ncbi:MAG: mechanosensitive ion channel domain-containing protein, partial [bacterium]
KDGPFESFKPTFSEADRIIERMFDLSSSGLKSVLEVQRKAGKVADLIQPLSMDLDGLLQALRGDLFQRSSPPMFSPAYYTLFKKELWPVFMEGVRGAEWPDKEFIMVQGWVVVLQFFFSLILVVGIYRHRKILEASTRWRFLLMRPFSASLFLAVSSLFPLYGNAVPSVWRLVLWVLVSLAAARIVGSLITLPWKRRLVYLLAGLFLAIHFFSVFGLPEPIFRFYVCLVALGGLPLCFWRAGASARRGDSPLYTWALRLGGAVFVVVLIAEVGGYSSLATHLLDAMIKTTFLVLLAWVVATMARGAVEFFLSNTVIKKVAMVRSNRAMIIRRLGMITDLFIGIIAMVLVLEIWRVFETPMDAMKGLFSFGFAVGDHRFTVGHVITAGAVLYSAFLVSWTVQSVLINDVFPKSHVGKGTGISIIRLFHYAMILVGVMLALGAMGFELKNLIIFTGALGIGIGFGLQNIANNFVSGLILLFERPIKVGDIVQITGVWGEVKQIGLRATVVETFDRAEIIVPNSDLVSNQVTNWTFSDRMARLVITVGIAYGSDVPLTMRLLSEAARGHPLVLKNPEPQVLFIRFGESSLDFELRIWIEDVRNLFLLKSELHQEIDRTFRASGVEIAFPQRDLHIRSFDAPVMDRLSGKTGAPPGPAGDPRM